MKKIYLFFLLALVVCNSILFCQWNLMTLGGGNAAPITCTKPGNFFVGTYIGVYRSIDTTNSWHCVTGNPSGGAHPPSINLIVGRGDTVIYTIEGHIPAASRMYLSTNNGSNWNTIESGSRINSIIFKDNYIIYACRNSHYLYRSSNLGQSWTSLGQGSGPNPKELMNYGSFIYSISSDGFWRSTDYGTTWDSVSNVDFSFPTVIGNLIVGMGSNTFYRSTDQGFTWNSSPTPMMYMGKFIYINGVIITTNYKSLDTGKTWNTLNTPNYMTSFATDRNVVYGSGGGVSCSTDNGITWKWRDLGLTILDISKLFADSCNIYAATSAGVGISRDFGNTWSDVYAFNPSFVQGFTKAGDNIFLATDSLVLKTSDNGFNWTQCFQVNTKSSAVAIGSNGTNVYLNLNRTGAFYSTNLGSNWIKMASPDVNIYKIAGIGSTIIFGGDSGLYKSSNYGLNWIKLNQGYFNPPVLDVQIINSYWVALTSSSIFKSSDNGITWLSISSGLPFSYDPLLQASGNNLFYTTYAYPHKFYFSTNFGSSWNQMNDEIMLTWRIYSITANNNYIYAGTDIWEPWGMNIDCYSGVYRLDSNFIITSIQDKNNISKSYQLFQNYPNPFNPTTKIKFQAPPFLPEGEVNVSLKIYDILGRETATLVNKKLEPGIYEVEWDATNYASGIYFYELRVGDYSTTKKMLLEK